MGRKNCATVVCRAIIQKNLFEILESLLQDCVNLLRQKARVVVVRDEDTDSRYREIIHGPISKSRKFYANTISDRFDRAPTSIFVRGDQEYLLHFL